VHSDSTPHLLLFFEGFQLIDAIITLIAIHIHNLNIRFVVNLCRIDSCYMTLPCRQK